MCLVFRNLTILLILGFMSSNLNAVSKIILKKNTFQMTQMRLLSNNEWKYIGMFYQELEPIIKKSSNTVYSEFKNAYFWNDITGVIGYAGAFAGGWNLFSLLKGGNNENQIDWWIVCGALGLAYFSSLISDHYLFHSVELYNNWIDEEKKKEPTGNKSSLEEGIKLYLVGWKF